MIEPRPASELERVLMRQNDDLRAQLAAANAKLEAAQRTEAKAVERAVLPYSNEELGIVFDALIEHRQKAIERKGANSVSTSDERANTCARIMSDIEEECANPARTTLKAHDAALVAERDAEIAALRGAGSNLRQAIQNLLQYDAVVMDEDGKKLVGLAYRSCDMGPCAEQDYEMWELAEAVEKWLKDKCRKALEGTPE